MSASSKSSKPTRASGAARVAQRAQCPDRVAVVGGEERRGAALGRQGQELAHGALGRRGVVRARGDELAGVPRRRRPAAPRGSRRGAPARCRATAGRRRRRCARGRGSGGARSPRARRRGCRAARCRHRSRAAGGRGRRSACRRRSRAADSGGRLRRGRSAARRPTCAGAEDQLALALGVLLARAGDEDVAASVRGVLDRARDRRVERVGDVLDDQPERVGAPVAQRAGDVVAREPQPRDRAPRRAQRCRRERRPPGSRRATPSSGSRPRCSRRLASSASPRPRSSNPEPLAFRCR